MTFRRTLLACLLVGSTIGAGMAWQRNGGSAAPPDEEYSWRGRRDPAVADSIVAGYERSLGSWTSGSITLRAPTALLSADEAAELARRLDERLAGMTRRLSGDAGRPATAPITVWCYPDFETKGLRTGNSLLEHADVDGATVHRVLERGRADGDGLAEAEIVLRRAGVRSTHAWLEAGALVWLADAWLGIAPDSWDERLRRMEVKPAPSELTARFDELSPFISWPAAGSLVGAAIRDAAAGTSPLEVLAALDAAPASPTGPRTAAAASADPPMPRFGGFIDAPGQAFATGAAMPRATTTFIDHRLHGVCLAHNHGMEWGYLSRGAADNLAYLKQDVNVSAVSVSPFGYLAGATDPHIRRFGRSRGADDAGEETDESLVAITARAHELGMDVLLAPHLWGRVWCGDWHAEDDAGWAALFAAYRDFAIHYALLAAYSGADVYQVGKELKATSGREAEWRALIADVRRIYPGPITYGANWDEYQHIAWWDAVDLIGINQYTPVGNTASFSQNNSRHVMAALADSLDALSLRIDRPWLMTEIGFTTAADSYKAPWKSFDPETDTHDPQRQAILYEAALDTYLGRTRCRGLFWWKWFTRLEANNRGRNQYDYPPYGKPAEKVLAARYGRPVDPAPNRHRVYADITQALEFRLYEGLPRRGSASEYQSEWSRSDLLRVEGQPFYPTPVALGPGEIDSLRAWSARQLDQREPNACPFHADWLLEWRAGDDVTRQLVCLGCGEVRTISHWASPRNQLSDPDRAALDAIVSKYRRPADGRQP